MPPRFGALYDQRIGTGFQRFKRLIDVVHLNDDFGIGLMDGPDERAYITKRQGNHRRTILQRQVKQFELFGHGKHDQPYAPGLLHLAHHLQFTRHPLRVAVTGTHQAEATGTGNRSRQTPTGRAAHGRQNQRVVNDQK